MSTSSHSVTCSGSGFELGAGTCPTHGDLAVFSKTVGKKNSVGEGVRELPVSPQKPVLQVRWQEGTGVCTRRTL